MKTIRSFIFLMVMLSAYQTKAQSSNTGFNLIVENYLKVEKALVNDDSRAANKSASALVGVIKKLDISSLNPEQKMAWNKSGEKIRYNSQHISESKSIDHQREHFSALSNDVYALLKTFKPQQTVYRQYCPMKKDYWLNASAQIQNPYYGKEMPDCGKVTETFKGNTQ